MADVLSFSANLWEILQQRKIVKRSDYKDSVLYIEKKKQLKVTFVQNSFDAAQHSFN